MTARLARALRVALVLFLGTEVQEKLLLRDEAGVPKWSGAGRRRGTP